MTATTVTVDADHRPRRGQARRWFWVGIAALVTGAAAALLIAIYPRNTTPAPDVIEVPQDAIPAPGDAPKLLGDFWLVAIPPADSTTAPGARRLLAYSMTCDYGRGNLEWRADLVPYDDPASSPGVFDCEPQSWKFTRTGRVFFGPATPTTLELHVTGDRVLVIRNHQTRAQWDRPHDQDDTASAVASPQ